MWTIVDKGISEMRTHLDLPKINNPLLDKCWHRLVWVWSVDLVDLVDMARLLSMMVPCFTRLGDLR